MADAPGTGAGPGAGMLEALLDAIHNEDNRIGGRAVTKLVAPLTVDGIAAEVLSTIGFGEYVTGSGDARLLIGDEIVLASGRTSTGPYTFTGLTRGTAGSEARAWPAGTLVYDYAENTSAIDKLRRGFFVDTAEGADLRVIARNLGLAVCPGITDDELRRVIRAIAYLPKGPLDAVRKTLEAYYGNTTSWSAYERHETAPWTIFVEVDVPLRTELRGRFYLGFHYLAADETVRQDAGNADLWAYLGDPFATLRCLLEQVRGAGYKIEIKTRT